MTTRHPNDPLPLPPGVWDALAKEILSEDKDKSAPLFPPAAYPTRDGPSETRHGVVVHRDLPHFLRSGQDEFAAPDKVRRSGFGAGLLLLCLVGAAAAGLGGYLISTNLSQNQISFAWFERLTGASGLRLDGRAPTHIDRPAPPSRVDTAFAQSGPFVKEPATTPSTLSPIAAANAATNAPSFETTITTLPKEPPSPATNNLRESVASLDLPNAVLPPPPAPAVAPPEPVARSLQPSPPRVATAESTLLVQRARKMIETTGDIAGARLILIRAAEIGDPQAAFLLAETYDASTLARWGVVGLKGDPATARRLYQDALAGGVHDARDRLAALGN